MTETEINIPFKEIPRETLEENGFRFNGNLDMWEHKNNVLFIDTYGDLLICNGRVQQITYSKLKLLLHVLG